ncbi:LuxR C-terminal-related transcriptional regulator [Bradyrhizobium algeriense]|uniref:LuxR C-terminal-related transcriptional regulator n=1 Tax=Bradyrhizobium algeriense TaxID=634784 RepID=UPI000D37704F|nr:LuxR C-terminal-related transcriptional regulator [Bradyrhizobium algeriense]
MLDVSLDQETFTRCIRLVIADRQPIVLQGLMSVFAAQDDFEIVASCSRGTSCLDAIRNLAPDVALVANTLPDLTVSEILAIAKAENLPTRLVFFAEPGDDDLTAAIAAGACSAISSYANPDTILRSLRLMTERTSARPKPSPDLAPNGKEVDGAKIEKMLRVLTPREREIIRLVAEGLSNKEIARQLNVSPGTVKVHLYNVFQKLEVSNRTVLATIALLQRSTGFGTLSLAALAFAISSDLKASDANAFLDEDSTADKDLEHSVFELWKKAILRHVIVADPGETVALTQRDSPIKVNQVTHSAARMEELHAAEQAALSNFGRGYGPIGSGTPCLFISPLLQAINQTGSPTAQQQFPPLEFASNSIKSRGGHGAFSMTAAGVGIYTLNNSHAAVQVLDPGETLVDTSTVATMDGTTQVATITIHGAGHVDPNDVDNLASGPVVHDSSLPLAFGQDSVTGEGNAGQIIHGVADDETLNGTGLVDVIYGGSGNDTIRGTDGDDTIYGGSGSDTINGNDTIIGGDDGDRLTGSKDDDIFVYLSAIDSNSTRFDTIIDFTSGEDKINLAAFGALAFLHLTSASKSVPPHTLAWIYNPASNETIVYVNPTDRSLDIGDPALLEIHLQGVVSVAELDFVYEQEAAAVAAALEGIDPALLAAAASDGTVVTADTALATIEADASESALVTAGIWTMPADDGLRFHFGRDRVGSNVSSRITNFGDDPTYATEESDDRAVTVPVHVSIIELAPSQATVLTEENFTFKNEPVHANTGAMATGNGKAPATAGFEILELGIQSAAPVAVAGPVEPGVAPGNSGGHGNSPPPSHPASAKTLAAGELTEPGVTSGNGVGHNNAHSSHPASAKALAAGELTEPGVTSGNGVGHNNAHSSHPASASTVEAAEPVEPGVAPGNSGGHGNSPHHSHSASEKALAAGELTEPGVTSGNGVGHNNAHSSHPISASTMDAAEPVEPDVAPGNSGGHGNPPHHSHSASAKALAAGELNEPGVTSGNGVGHNNSHSSHPISASTMEAAEPVEPDVAPGNSGGGHGNPPHPSHSASAKASAAGELNEPGVTSGNGVGHNNAHSSHPISASTMDAAEPVEPDVAPGNSGGGHGNPPHPSHSASAKALAAGELTEPGVTSGNGVGHNNAHSSHPASASTMDAAEPVEPDVAPGNSGGGHGNPPHPSHSASAKASAAGELTEPGVTSGNGVGHNNAHSSHPISASTMDAAEPVEPDVAPGNSGGHGNPPHHSHSASAKASAAGELNEPGVTSGNGVGHNNSHSSHPISASIMEAAEPVEPDVASGNSGSGHGNPPHPSHSASAKASTATPQPAEPAFGTSGAGHESTFHFKDQAPPSTPTAPVELEELNDTPVLHGAKLAAILEMGSAAMEEHATSHDNNGQHHSIAHSPHELLT